MKQPPNVALTHMGHLIKTHTQLTSTHWFLADLTNSTKYLIC